MGTLLNRRRYMGGGKDKPSYLTFVAEEAGTFTFSAARAVTLSDITSVSYSIDDGNTWVTATAVEGQGMSLTTPVIPAGSRVMWKGIANRYSFDANGNGRFSSQKAFHIIGHLASLFIGDDYIRNEFPSTVGNFACNRLFPYSKVTSIEGMIFPEAASNNCYMQMFVLSSSLVSAKDVEIRVRSDAQSVLDSMFLGCSSLLIPPVLPSTEINRFAYTKLFSGCTSLETPPELPATVFNEGYVYSSMFLGCTSLSTPPELPAATLTRECYSSMFNGCTSLVKSPVLAAKTLGIASYASMFYGCTNLSQITMLATSLGNNSLNNWVNGVNATGTFIKDASMTTLPSGVSGIPDGWTVQDYVE